MSRMHGPRLCGTSLRAAPRPGHETFCRIGWHRFASSRRVPPELCIRCRPQRCRGRREDRVPAGTRGPLCESVCFKKAAQRHTGLPQHPAFPAQWFYGLCRALPGERCTIAPVALRMIDARARLGFMHHRKPWRTDPGRQDHTISPYARLRPSCARGACSRSDPPCKLTCARRCLRPPHSQPAFVTIAIRPSARVGVRERCDNSEF